MKLNIIYKTILFLVFMGLLLNPSFSLAKKKRAAKTQTVSSQTQTTTTTTQPATPFEANVWLKYVYPTGKRALKTHYHDGVFIDDPVGGTYKVCGRVDYAKGIATDSSGYAYITINGADYRMQHIASNVSGYYTFCGNFEVKPQPSDIEGNRDNMAEIFNNILVEVTAEDGQVAKERFSVVNAPTRALEDIVHEKGITFLLNDRGEDGNQFSDYASHMVNDLLHSSNEALTAVVDKAIKESLGDSCNLKYMYDAAQESTDDIKSTIALAIFQPFYKIFNDLDNNELMFLCFDSAKIQGEDLEFDLGTDQDEMMTLGGEIRKLVLRFDFTHRYDSSMIHDNDMIETGTLVVEVGPVVLDTILGNLKLEDGVFAGDIAVNDLGIERIHAYWENYVYYDVSWSANPYSGADEIDDFINSEYADGIDLNEEDENSDTISFESDFSLDTGSEELSFIFQPAFIYANQFALIMEEMIADVPEEWTDDYTAQEDYVTTVNNGLFNNNEAAELVFSLDDDIVNQQMLVKTIAGELSQFSETPLPNGDVLEADFSANIAPVTSLDGDDEYTLRMDINNASLKLHNQNSGVSGEYRVDLAIKVDVIPSDDPEKFLTAERNDVDVNVIQISGGTAASASVLDNLIVKQVDSILENKIEPMLRDLIKGQVDDLLGGLPFDTCTTTYLGDMHSSLNYLAATIDLDYNDIIYMNDTCFEIPVTTNVASTGEPIQNCDKNPDDICNDHSGSDPSVYQDGY